MIRIFSWAALGLCLVAGVAAAEGNTRLGYGRLITNDYIGDGHDRWRTGSVASSRVWGPSWQGELPEEFGSILEFRLNGEIMAPDNLVTPAAGDRRFAGSWSIGLHTHYQRNSVDIAMGLDMVLTGPMTQLGDFQQGLHDLLGVESASDATLGAQIGDGVHPTFVLEMGRDLSFGETVTLRPFLEARAGAETLVRAGADLTLGRVGQGELLVRDPANGQRYRVIQQNTPGYSLILGGDVAYVHDSVFLPESDGYTLSDSRNRLRAGLHWQGERSSIFYGLTWLGEEFQGQGEGQLVGSMRLNLDF